VTLHHLLGGHFGDSIGTFAHTQFFQEPSSPTQAVPDVDGAFLASVETSGGVLAAIEGRSFA